MSNTQEIYFHVGLGKVASTYLQHRFFPKLKGLRYIPTNRYKRSREIIKTSDDKKILVSREFDRQLERELAWFTTQVPNPNVIIIFRRHGGWIASQYRRYVKNGWFWSFNKFLDLKHDEGFWKKDDLLFYPKLEIIEKYTGKKPLILFHNDLKTDPEKFFQQIANFCGAEFRIKDISLEPVHTSYSEKQLLVLRSFCRRFVKKVPKSYHNKVLHWLLYRPWWGFFHLVMYAASLFPKSWVPREVLIEKDRLDQIDQLFDEDWQRIAAYAEAYNPKLAAL